MEEFSNKDKHYMTRALALAACGRYTVGANPMVGCVIVRDDKIISENYHRRSGEAHAELLALAGANDGVRDATVYITLEPCVHQGRTPPCVPKLIEAKIKRIVIAMPDPDPRVNGQGISALKSAGIQVECGLLGEPARALNRGFVSRMERGRPWLRLKSATSLDGHIALNCGKSAWISSNEARHDVQFWRAQSDAILTSGHTVNADDPQLNVRLDANALGIEGKIRQPMRVVLDRRLSTSPTARIYNTDAQSLIIIGDPSLSAARIGKFEKCGVEMIYVETIKSRLVLLKILEILATQYEVNEIQVEAGGILFGAIIEADLCDELLLYIAPCLLGDKSKNLANFDCVKQTMKDRIDFNYKEVVKIGKDIRILAEPCPRLS